MSKFSKVKIVVEETSRRNEKGLARKVYKVLQVKNITTISVTNNYLEIVDLESYIRNGADVTINPRK